MDKRKVLVIFGGMSTEHEVSRMSVTSILCNIDKNRYDVGVTGIDKDGTWLEYMGEYDKILNKNWKEYTKPINNLFEYISNFDIAFPVLHGLYGEDGTIQGLFELLKIPYVGCKVLSSSVSMDKAYTKILFDRANIPQLPYEYLYVDDNKNIKLIDKEFNELYDENDIITKVENKVGYPCFVKPSNSGSSVGIKKAESKEELLEAIKFASKYDKKILIEKGIDCREIESAILEENDEVKVSVLGEILAAGEFYTYESKYEDENSRLSIPAKVDKNVSDYIRDLAIKAFRAVDGKGLARVDFFIDKNTNKVYINEINTIPGFTNISMYPKLWENSGVSYTDLISKLIDNELYRS